MKSIYLFGTQALMVCDRLIDGDPVGWCIFEGEHSETGWDFRKLLAEVSSPYANVTHKLEALIEERALREFDREFVDECFRTGTKLPVYL